MNLTKENQGVVVSTPISALAPIVRSLAVSSTLVTSWNQLVRLRTVASDGLGSASSSNTPMSIRNRRRKRSPKLTSFGSAASFT